MYGTGKATIVLCESIQDHFEVILIAPSKNKSFHYFGFQCYGYDTETEIPDIVKGIGSIEISIGISNSYNLTYSKANHYLIYHHGPHPVQGNVSYRFLNFLKIKLIVVSEYSKSQQIGYGYKEELILVIPNGLEKEYFTEYNRKKNKKQKNSFVFAGHIVDYKGVDLLPEVFKSLPDMNLFVCGENRNWNHIYVEKNHNFKKYMDQDGYPDWNLIEADFPNIKYLGELEKRKLVDLLLNSIYLIIPSRIPETFGIIVIEAMACGCVPILPNYGGFSELVEHCKNGFLYETNDIISILDAINRAVEIDWNREKISQEVLEKYDWEYVKKLLRYHLINLVINTNIDSNYRMLVFRILNKLTFLKKIISWVYFKAFKASQVR